MKTYNVFNKQELDSALDDLKNLYRMAKEVRGKDPAITVAVKKYRKPKTSAQHRQYFRCIGELVKAFREVGYITNQESAHAFVKRESGYTDMVETKTGRIMQINKSVADNSEHINSKEMNRLIEFAVQFAAQELNYVIDMGDRNELSN